MVYKWNVGYFTKVNPQVAGEVCEQLAAENKLTAQSLVDISEPETAPLHNAFEWDNQIAGNEWRKYQARNIIHSLVIVREEAEPQKVYFNLDKKENEYTHIDVILSSEDDYQKMMSNALKELIAFQRKYARLSALKPVFDAIDNLSKDEE